MKRREIRIGERVVTGMVCEICPLPMVIYPEETMAKHLALHAARAATGSLELNPPRPHPHRGGRTAGGRNRMQMSSTGVQIKHGNRLSR